MCDVDRGGARATRRTGVPMIPFYMRSIRCSASSASATSFMGGRGHRARAVSCLAGTAGRTTLERRGPAARGRPLATSWVGDDPELHRPTTPRYGYELAVIIQDGLRPDATPSSRTSTTTSPMMNENYRHTRRCRTDSGARYHASGHVPVPARRREERQAAPRVQLLGIGHHLPRGRLPQPIC